MVNGEVGPDGTFIIHPTFRGRGWPSGGEP